MTFLDRSSALMTASTRGTRDLPRAAVEIIARLSAERSRLRDEVASLRSELRQAPRPEDMSQLRAERDALARQLADAHQRLSKQETSGAFQRLQGRQVEAMGQLAERLERAVTSFEARSRNLDRLEQAVARLESAPTSTHKPVPVPATSSPVPAPGHTTRPMPRGGGMLAGLMRENVALRSGENPRPAESSQARTRAETTPRPEPTSSGVSGTSGAQARLSQSRPAPRGGGPLGGLLTQNLGLRRPGTTIH